VPCLYIEIQKEKRWKMLDLMIRNAYLIDGTGTPGFYADLGIKDDKIETIRKPGSETPRGVRRPLKDDKAKRMVNAEGLAVSPGFIDIHSHSDALALLNPYCESKVRQGITLEVCGNCGVSPGPLFGAAREEAEKYYRNYGISITWRTLDEFLDKLESKGLSINFASLIGHGTVRASVMGYEDRQPTSQELFRMRELVDQGMRGGAFGLSTGLIYAPGCYAQTEELIELSKVVGRYGGFYASHIRSEGERWLEAISEVIEIGRQANLPVQISHFKVGGSKNLRKICKAFELIDCARSGGLEVTCDQYPYIATSTSLSVYIPSWALEGGTEALISRLKNPLQRKKIKAQIEVESHKIFVSLVRKKENKIYQGKTVAEIAKRMNKEPREVIFDLLISEDGIVQIVRFALSEANVQAIMPHPAVMVGTDASALAPYGLLGEGKPHQRAYGTFPRVLGRYVREKKILRLEEAIRKMTGLPAQRLGLKDRGLIKSGFFADLVIFDPEKIGDRASFQNPHRFPKGIEYVMVNGKIVVEKGEHTKVLSGKVLRR